jgi:Protein of unknown function (DUF2878)
MTASEVSLMTPSRESPPFWRIAVNFVLFQAAWFACVAGAAHEMPWLGIAAVLAVVAAHLLSAVTPATEAMLIVIAMGIGAVWDTLLAQTQWVTYAPGALIANTAPLWIIALWGLFATALNVSLNWLKGRDVLGAVAGAIAGPMSYYGGAKLGGLTFNAPIKAIVALAIGWAIFVPVLMRLAIRFNGISPRAAPTTAAS